MCLALSCVIMAHDTRIACRSTISTKQAEAEAAGAAVSEATSREQSAAKAVEDASRRMAELQAELEQLKQDERREQLRIQVGPNSSMQGFLLEGRNGRDSVET